ncbi:MAG: hypothetical protein ACYDEO_28150 [Aggregatilineales bacterium]
MSQQPLATAQAAASTATQAFFNNRLPDYLVLAYGNGCLTHLTIVDSMMNVTPIDLTKAFPQTECIWSANV